MAADPHPLTSYMRLAITTLLDSIRTTKLHRGVEKLTFENTALGSDSFSAMLDVVNDIDQACFRVCTAGVTPWALFRQKYVYTLILERVLLEKDATDIVFTGSGWCTWAWAGCDGPTEVLGLRSGGCKWMNAALDLVCAQKKVGVESVFKFGCSVGVGVLLLSCDSIIADTEEDCLGAGEDGTTYKARVKSALLTGLYAVKRVRRGEAPSCEVEALVKLQGHQHVVTLQAVCTAPSHKCLVLEILNETLYEFRCRRWGRGLPVQQDVRNMLCVFRPMFTAICQAVAAVHCNGFAHHDVHPGNVMITFGGVTKLIDFSRATPVTAVGVSNDSTGLLRLLYWFFVGQMPEIVIGDNGYARLKEMKVHGVELGWSLERLLSRGFVDGAKISTDEMIEQWEGGNVCGKRKASHCI